jgi:hypothetical protein
MTHTRKIVAAVGIAIVAAGLSGEAFAATKHRVTGARQLARQMDTNRNGVVSRKEFLRYEARRGGSRAAASRAFSGLDTNKNGRLSIAELRPMTSPNWASCEALALRRGIAVNEREGHLPGDLAGPSPWKQFMDSCLAGKVLR